MQNYIPDQWYGILDAKEVRPGKTFSCHRLGLDLVLWRDTSGQVVAMEDRCPHRQAKLSAGKVVEGCVECPFHGFRYDAQGECQLIPANGKVGSRPKVFKVKTFAVREEYGFIWLWNGEFRLDYPSVPFFNDENLENYTYVTSQRIWPIHYTRVIENQLDLAHPPFVHARTIGRGKLTVVDQLFTLLKDNTLFVWSHQKREDGQPVSLSKELEMPQRHWDLAFKFPNLWRIWFGGRFKALQVIAPINDESTIIYSRVYNNISNFRALQGLIGRLYSPLSNAIAREDRRVISTQYPKMGGLNSGDKYIPADRPILQYHKHRERLIDSANAIELADLAASIQSE